VQSAFPGGLQRCLLQKTASRKGFVKVLEVPGPGYLCFNPDRSPYAFDSRVWTSVLDWDTGGFADFRLPIAD